MRPNIKENLKIAAKIAEVMVVVFAIGALQNWYDSTNKPPTSYQRLREACRQVVVLNDRLSGITPKQGTKPVHSKVLRPELWDLYRVTCDRP